MGDKWIAVTGASGFVGRNISNMLKANGYNILALCRSVPDALFDKHIAVDISDCTAMPQAVDNIPDLECVVHAAASRKQDESAIISNVLGTYNVFKYLGKHTKCVCNISSIIIIGIPESPIITEEHIIKPKTLYHLSKYQAELLCNLPEFEDLYITTLRFTSPIGSGMPKGLIVSTFIENCLNNNTIKINGNGNRVMNYIDTRDIARAVLLVIKKANLKGTYLLNGTSISNIELARLCINVTHSISTIMFSGVDDLQDTHKWVIDGSKALKDFEYSPAIRLEESLRDIADSLR